VLWLPDVRPLKAKNPQSTAMIDLRLRQAKAKGQKLDLRWTWTPWGGISEHLRHAVLTSEDDMFYQHKGIDWDAIQVALERDWKEKRLAYGGSTITQQVAKNLYLSPSRNPLRKVKEALITYRLEKELGKRRIFEIYLNIAEWGKGIFGAEAAARAYFGKSAADLNAEEAAALAAVLPNPRRWNPASDSKYVARNSRRIMQRMKESGFLPDEEEGEEYDDVAVSSDTAGLLSGATEALLAPLPSIDTELSSGTAGEVAEPVKPAVAP
jgi:monofunctional glycosyltransferase